MVSKDDFIAELQQLVEKQAKQILALTDNKKEVPWDDQWHTVKVIRDNQSGSIDVFFDDMKTPHLSIFDKSFGKGRIGIGSFDDMNTFDDVRLYGK